MQDTNLSKFIFPAAAAFAFFFGLSSPLALSLGIFLALTLKNPYQAKTKKLVTPLLQYSIVGLGAGMDLNTVFKAGMNGIVYTVIGIALTIFIGDTVLRKLFRSESDTSFLITVGTAICGGSAIAAVSGAIRANDHDVSVALATVFILNSIALILFPPIGHFANLSEIQFGLWSALAIHDTSSVVGASMQYGPRALEVATTVKLARALWIVPITLAVSAGWLGRRNSKGSKSVKKPWFILGFIATAALTTWVPTIHPYGLTLYSLSKRLLMLTLFLIGANLTWATLKNVGIKPLLHGLSLWILVATITLVSILVGWIH